MSVAVGLFSQKNKKKYPNWCYSQRFAVLWENVIKSIGAVFRLVIYEPPAEAATFETNWKSLYTNSAI